MSKGTISEVKPPEVKLPEVEGQQEAQLEALERPRCVHHWLIETPQGATSKGVCKLCGAMGEFRNATSGAYWESDSGSDVGDWRRRAPSLTIASDDDELAMAPSAEPALVV